MLSRGSILWLLLSFAGLAHGQVLNQFTPQVDPTAVQNLGVLDVCSKLTYRTVTLENGMQIQRPDIKAEVLGCVAQPPAPWKVKKVAWDAQDEMNWQSFVQALGRSKCGTVDDCLLSVSNPYRDQLDFDGAHYSDCADFPMYIRAYFAFKNNLPFSFGLELKPNEMTEEQKVKSEERYQQAVTANKVEDYFKSLNDIRISVNGNHFTSRLNVPASNGTKRDFFGMIDYIHNIYNSGSYRMLTTPEGYPLPDFYSPVIDRENIVPGTVLYKATGHLALVYDVTEEGDILYVDAHPDNSVSRGVYTSEFYRTSAAQGGGIKKFRPMTVTSPKYDKEGNITSGRMLMPKDEAIMGQSKEQYFGNVELGNLDWKSAKFRANGVIVDYYEYVRMKLSTKPYSVDPLNFFKRDLEGVCSEMQRRVRAVDLAVAAGIPNEAHPEQLPVNIYSAEGFWETYSSPALDMRLKNNVLSLIENAKSYMRLWKNQQPYLKYNGSNLKKDLLKIYHQVNSRCEVSYVNSKSRTVTLPLTTAISRLTRSSFDPYFCVERRWGAHFLAESASCSENPDKADWYVYQQFLRNLTERDPTEIMSWTLNDLMQMHQQGRVDNTVRPEKYDVLKVLEQL